MAPDAGLARLISLRPRSAGSRLCPPDLPDPRCPGGNL